MTKTVYLYDPRTNITTETTIKKLASVSGNTINSIQKCRLYNTKIRSLNCYVTSEKQSVKQRYEWYSKEEVENEFWKIVDGSDGKYKVSNHGRVKRIFKSSERFCLPFLRGRSRNNLFVKIQFLNRYADIKVAHVVAHHFIRPRNTGDVVYRKNGIVTDDYAGNLKYISKEELGRLTGFKAKSKPVVKICLESQEVIDEYRSAREAGRNNYLSYQAVLDNCNGVSRLAGGMKFMFSENYEKRGIEKHG